MYDANQAVQQYQSDPSKLLEGRVFPLRLNLRNTQAIAKATEPLYFGPPIEPVGPIGEAPVASYVLPAERGIQLATELIRKLLNDEGLSKEDIAVLASDRSMCVKMEKSLGGLAIRTSLAGQSRGGAVTVDTIRRFKGLESLVVLLIVDRLTAEHQELCYVAVSRARSRLFVIGDFAGTRLASALMNGVS